MNIFWLDANPRRAAMYHCDKHVVNQIKEYSQILGEALKQNGHDWEFLRSSYPDHPQVKWAAESRQNWMELYELTEALYEEKKYRYGGGHASFEEGVEPIDVDEIGMPTTGATNKRCTVKDAPLLGHYVETYRNYYVNHKDWDMSWTKRSVPDWWEDYY